LRQQGRSTAQLHLLFNPSGTFAGEPADLEAVAKDAVSIGAGEAEVTAIRRREHHAAGVKLLQMLTQPCESE